jgi:hypothetical protein
MGLKVLEDVAVAFSAAMNNETANLPRPLSVRDVDRSPVPLNMIEPVADACPKCGGHNMKVGDWVCWGVCYRCYLEHGDNK